MSIDSVVAQMGAGQTFEGWRLPTLSEVFNVSHHFFGQRLGHVIEGSYNTYQKPGTRSRGGSRYFPYESAMGQTYIANRTVDRRSRGLFVNTEDANLQGVLMSGLDYYTADSQANDVMYHYSNFQGGYSTAYADASYGVFLVSDGGATKTTQDDMSLMANNPNSPYNATAVPEPAGLAMLVAGLFMLAFKRRRSNSL
jgi:hypothetical protein